MYRPDKIKNIINKIENERSKGGTWQEISDKFNSDKFPTICGKKWTFRNLFNYYSKHK